jgi:hypothetical protein
MNAVDPHTLAEGLVAYAIAISEMGGSEVEFRSLALSVTTDPGIFGHAIEALPRLAEPVSFSPVRAERYERMAKLVGAKTVVEQLEARLQAREWLERLRRDLAALD